MTTTEVRLREVFKDLRSRKRKNGCLTTDDYFDLQADVAKIIIEEEFLGLFHVPPSDVEEELIGAVEQYIGTIVDEWIDLPHTKLIQKIMTGAREMLSRIRSFNQPNPQWVFGKPKSPGTYLLEFSKGDRFVVVRAFTDEENIFRLCNLDDEGYVSDIPLRHFAIADPDKG